MKNSYLPTSTMPNKDLRLNTRVVACKTENSTYFTPFEMSLQCFSKNSVMVKVEVHNVENPGKNPVNYSYWVPYQEFLDSYTILDTL